MAVKSDYTEKKAEEENPKKEKVAKSQQDVSGVKIYFPRVNDSIVF